MTKFLALAIKIANNAENNYRHGAVMVKGGRVLAMAPNIYKNTPTIFEREYPNNLEMQKESIREHCSVHAEARVVKMVGADVCHGATIYVARVNNKGESLMSKPCDKCYELLTEVGIKTVVYTDTTDSNNTIYRNSDAYSLDRIVATVA